MKNICIDFGNTFSKIGYFHSATLVEFIPKCNSTKVIEYCKSVDFERIIICSVIKTAAEILEEFKVLNKPIIILLPDTKIPIQKDYETPQTLGADRLAAAVGASIIYPKENCVIIDMGTCIKYDLVDNLAIFRGGIIGPGMRMRFKAMNHFTKKLPLIEEINPWPPLIGKNTKTAMQSGVLNGMVAEINGIIEEYTAQLTKFKIILCGGDAPFFESRLKYPTFVLPELVLVGLNKILLFNIE
jgi:type III pantothenate kinase